MQGIEERRSGPRSLHVPAVTQDDANHGIWRVYCLACSHANQRYVYRCKLGEDGPWPAVSLFEPP